MTDAEILAVFGGLIVGYWLVSKFLSRNEKPKEPPVVPPVSADQPPPRTAATSPPWNQVLFVSKEASIDDIKAAYKDLIRQYHPDKVATLGQELRDMAERKSKEINAAYQAALRERGGRA
jgi:DnaJ domain